MSYAGHVYHVYAVRTNSRESLMQELTAQGVQTGIHYPIPVHLQKAYADPAFQAGDFIIGYARQPRYCRCRCSRN